MLCLLYHGVQLAGRGRVPQRIDRLGLATLTELLDVSTSREEEPAKPKGVASLESAVVLVGRFGF